MIRDYESEPRQIIVKWVDDVTGKHEKKFAFEAVDEAFKFASKTFMELCM